MIGPCPTCGDPADETPIETLPPWLNHEAWDAFRHYRTEIGSPMTVRGEMLLLGDLRTLAEGSPQLQAAIIEQTIATGRWTGLYALKGIANSPAASSTRRGALGSSADPWRHMGSIALAPDSTIGLLRVAAALFELAGSTGAPVRVPWGELAAKAGVSRASVGRALAWLRRRGVVDVERFAPGVPNAYHIAPATRV